MANGLMADGRKAVVLATLADRDLNGRLSKTRMAVRKLRGGKTGEELMMTKAAPLPTVAAGTTVATTAVENGVNTALAALPPMACLRDVSAATCIW